MYPDPAAMRGPENAKARRQWSENADFQILRNPHALPCAWIVHAARAIPTLAGSDQEDRKRFLDEMAYCGDICAKMGLRSSIRSLLHGWTVTRSERLHLTFPTSCQAQMKWSPSGIRRLNEQSWT